MFYMAVIFKKYQRRGKNDSCVEVVCILFTDMEQYRHILPIL